MSIRCIFGQGNLEHMHYLWIKKKLAESLWFLNSPVLSIFLAKSDKISCISKSASSSLFGIQHQDLVPLFLNVRQTRYRRLLNVREREREREREIELRYCRFLNVRELDSVSSFFKLKQDLILLREVP